MSRDSCRLCGSVLTFFCETQTPKAKYLKCGNCSLIQQAKEELLAPNEERARYETHNNTVESKGYVDFLNRFIGEFEEWLDPSMKALDFGCGPGPVLSFLLRERGLSVDNYDPFFFPESPRQHYGLVTCCEVVEHFHDPRKSWEALVSFVAPGGWLAVRTEMVDRFSEVNSFVDWYYHRDPTHISFYSRSTVEWIASSWGLEIFRLTDQVAIFKNYSETV